MTLRSLWLAWRVLLRKLNGNRRTLSFLWCAKNTILKCVSRDLTKEKIGFTKCNEKMNVLLRIKHLEKQPQKIVIPFFFEKFGQKNFSVCLLFLNKNTAF